MRQVAVVTVVLLIAGGCSIPEKQLIDATVEVPPYSCLGQPLPTTAREQITISGALKHPSSGTNIANAVIEAFLVNEPQKVLFSMTTNADGKFTRAQGTGGAPRDLFLRTAPNGYLSAYYYPAVPLSRDLTTDIQLLVSEEVAQIAGFVGVEHDPTKVVYVVTVVDCNGVPVSGATVTANPPGDVRYLANTTPSEDAIATDATGSAFIFNVPPGNTTINANAAGMTLRSHSLNGFAGAIMQTDIQP